MSYVIYINEDGIEISRRPKTRGRQPKGKLTVDGDILVTVSKDEQKDLDIPAKERKHRDIKIEVPDKSGNSEDKVEIKIPNIVVEAEEPTKRKKVIKIKSPVVSLDTFLSGLRPMTDNKITEGKVTIHNAMVLRDFGTELNEIIPPSSLYHRIEIDTISNIIKVWVLPSSTPISRINSLKMKSETGDITDEQEDEERKRGNMFVDPPDREIEGCLILNENGNQ